MSQTLKAGVLACGVFAASSCGNNAKTPKETAKEPEFEVIADRFADLQVLRYRVDGFENLTLNQKKLAYYLYEAALCGRDIIYDQRYRHNLAVRKVLEAIVGNYQGDKENEEWKKLMVYAKRFWFSNGLHHHYSNIKFIPECSPEYFEARLRECKASSLPLEGASVDEFWAFLKPVIFDPSKDAKMVDLSPGIDNVVASANNFYEGVTQKEVEEFYAKKMNDGKDYKPEYGLNSKLVKENGVITEKIWKVGGMYTASIEKMVFWLEKALTVAENQQHAIRRLINYYRSGDVNDWDAYNIVWVKDTSSVIDVVNGFVEVYNDALGKRGSFESVVSMKDFEASKRIAAIAKEAQWFEDNSPLIPKHKKPNVTGIDAKVITVIVESGDAAPTTPIGINLPNNNWIREQHGSKSVSLGNIVRAYNDAKSKGSLLEEFVENEETRKRIKEFGNLAADLTTDMHEVIGHASGKLEPGVSPPDVTLKQYSSTLEEARADLVALYYIMDQKLIDIGVMTSLETGKAEYDSYIMNGLMTQLTRLQLGENVEEAHMRNRQLVSKWAYEKGKADNVIEFYTKDGKTYVRVNDYEKLRGLFGDLLREIQRIKSVGDFAASQKLVEDYGVQVDRALHEEVLERFKKLNLAPYNGFIQPRLVPKMDGNDIIDVTVEYPTDFVEQMLEYGRKYSLLPVKN